MSTHKKILFKGQPFILMGGALTTAEAFKRGEASYAHFWPEKDAVKRFGKLIGTGADIVETGETVEVKMDLLEIFESFLTMLDGVAGEPGSTWKRPEENGEA